MSIVLPPLYAILDPEQTKGRAAARVLRQLLDGGAKLLQLRVKALAPRDFLTLAREVRGPTRDAGCQLIVNDRIDIALACDADGVHLPAGDLSNMTHFYKNLVMAGGFLYMMHYGPGGMSIDGARSA